MSACNKTIRDGTNQLERLAVALSDQYVRIDERSQRDLLHFIYRFSQELAYYNSPTNQPNGSWQAILENLPNLPDNTELLNQDESPHLALLNVLTKLYAHAQEELNKVTQNHLNYYYREVLNIRPKPASADQVQLVFELAKSRLLNSFQLKANTTLLGKAINGTPIEYRTDHELIVSKATVSQIKSLFVEKSPGGSRIFAAPVANSKDGLGQPLEEAAPYWATFGEPQLQRSVEAKTMVDAQIGFAVSSPVLLLQEGHRIIDITIHFLPTAFVPAILLQNSFRFYYSATGKWVEPQVHTSGLVFGKSDPPIADELDHWQLKLHIVLGAGQEPFTFFDARFFEEKFPTDWPILKVVLKPESLGYDTLVQLETDRIDIEVEARGMRNLVLQNDLGVLDPGKPHLPFGSQPVLNSAYYIGSAEVFQKKLHYLQLQINWHEIPDSQFSTWYRQYGVDQNFGNNNFKTRIRLLLNRSWDQDLLVSEPLFNTNDANEPLLIEAPEIQFDLIDNFQPAPTKTPLQAYDVTTDRGFIRLDLTGPEQPFKAFGHKEFANIYTRQAIALSRFDPATDTADPPELPNPPYTPTIKALSLSYRSRQRFRSKAQNYHHQFFQITPFGFRGGHLDMQARLVPVYEEEGAIMIGLEGVAVPQTLSFLFDLEEGTARQDVVLKAENIQWSYLSHNAWIQISSHEILVDGTQAFKQSGIISVVLPKDATDDNQVLPAGLFWLKAGVKTGAEGAAGLRMIYTNAVSATLIMEDKNLDGHLSQPLPAGSVGKLAARTVDIKNVHQPLPSSGGRPAELSPAYYTRINERLSHKNRAIQSWDFERLVLEAFPNIFKVKCLPHTDPASEQAPGATTLIIVSNLRNQDSGNPFQPRTSQVVLEQIQAYIRKYTSPFLKIYVEQPVYESILVDAKIGFLPGYDIGFYSRQLNTELKQFLSPWAFNNGEDIVIGGTIYKSSILEFMERLEYVDYVVDFKLYHKNGGQPGPGVGEMEIGLDFEIATPVKPGIGGMEIGLNYIVGSDVPFACATTARTILVSAAEHRISALRPDEYVCSGASSLGIGFMAVNVDFILGEDF